MSPSPGTGAGYSASKLLCKSVAGGGGGGAVYQTRR